MKAFAAALLLAITPAALAVAESPAPTADATNQAKARFRKGTDLYRQARYRDAIEEFEAAYRLRPHGVIFYNLAQCHERLGDIPAALRAYHEYLRAVPAADDRSIVHAAMANLEARLGASGVQQLLVYSDPPAAEVYVDGQPRGRTPFSAALPLGTHVLTLVKPGYATITREAVLAPDRSIELDVNLARADAAAGTAAAPPPFDAPSPGAAVAAATPAPSLAPAAQMAEVKPLRIASPPEVKVAPARPRRWTWVAAGVAGAALAAGAGFGLAARSASQDLRASEHDGATAQRLADSASSRARSANVLYAASAVAGAAGVTLFFVEGRF